MRKAKLQFRNLSETKCVLHENFAAMGIQAQKKALSFRMLFLSQPSAYRKGSDGSCHFYFYWILEMTNNVLTLSELH